MVLIHRIGTVELGESSVIVVGRAPHRAEAFEAARFAIDALKLSAPIWKHEVWQDGPTGAPPPARPSMRHRCRPRPVGGTRRDSSSLPSPPSCCCVAIGLIAYSRRPRQDAGLTSFRRHIDALSPESRREVMDRVRRRSTTATCRARRPDDAEPTGADGLTMARDLAIDLGTANTLVYMKGRGIVLNEPSVIALNRQTGEVLATGREAWQMIGRTPGYIVAVRPLRGGAITDFEITERMIRLLLQRVGVSRFTRPKVVICVPSAITEVERRAVTDAARRAGAADAQLIEQPMAAAIGADLPIDEPVGNMVIDIGGGTSETAVISLGGIVALEAVRVGSFDIDAAIQEYVRREHGIAIGERTAEEVKVAIGSADPTDDENQAEVRGRDLMSGLPKTVVLTPEEIRLAIDDVISSIIASVVRCLSKAPPELAQDFLVRGMYLVGGGGLLRGLAQRIERETQVPVRMSTMPLEAVVHRCRSLHRALRRVEGDVHGGSPLSAHPSRPHRRTSSKVFDGIRRQFKVPDRVSCRGAARLPTTAAKRAPTRARRPHRSAVRHARPGGVDRSRSGLPHRDGRRRRAVALRDRRRRLVRRRRRSARRRGVATRRHAVPARRQGRPVSARACRGCGQPAARWSTPGGRLHVRVDADGPSKLDGVERSVIRSRAKLAYETVQPAQLPDAFPELARRIALAEEARGAARIEPLEQEMRRRPASGGYDISFRPRLKSEDDNAAMSLATNLAVADALFAADTGLFRVMPEPDAACRAATCATRREPWARMAGRRRRCASSHGRSTATSPSLPRC